MVSATITLKYAEARDKYRRKCSESQVNAIARKNQQYAPFFISPDDLTRLNMQIFKINLLNGADIMILHSSADNGYPHTRPNAIVCLPESFITSSSNEVLYQTLCHEAIHIHQRKFPDLWKQKCIDEGWTPLTKDEIPQRFVEQCRINPDTMSCPFWAWDTHHVPLPMFRSSSPSSLEDVRIEWLDRRTGAIFHQPPPSFTAKYGSPSQSEHPYEIYAVIYAQNGINSYSSLYEKLVSSS
jgi:hypothetical protein